MEDAAAEIVRLADETKTPNVSIDAHFVESEIPLAESTLTLSPATGVDISLSLFPGQGAVVTGPTVDDKVHYYLLKLAE